MLDGIQLERKGTPTATILTDQFEVNGRAMAETHGASDYLWAVTAHPISNKTDAELGEEARRLLPAVVRLLTRGDA